MSDDECRTINWREIIPPGWKAKCCVCKGELTTADWRNQNVVATFDGPRLTACCHAHHIANPAEYEASVRAMAQTVAANLR